MSLIENHCCKQPVLSSRDSQTVCHTNILKAVQKERQPVLCSQAVQTCDTSGELSPKRNLTDLTFSRLKKVTTWVMLPIDIMYDELRKRHSSTFVVFCWLGSTVCVSNKFPGDAHLWSTLRNHSSSSCSHTVNNKLSQRVGWSQQQQQKNFFIVILMCLTGSMVIHLMLPETRGTYELEKLWTLHSYDDQLAQIAPETLPEDFILGLEDDTSSLTSVEFKRE